MQPNIEQLNKRLTSIFISKSSLAYKSAIEAISNPAKKIRVGKNTGSGRYSSSTEWQGETVRALTAAGVVFEFGNDSPRCGKAGNWVMVTSIG